jgi:enhancing lycopene biosynthesis protein 2
VISFSSRRPWFCLSLSARCLMRLSPRTIYDSYLRGPVAVMRLFEQTFGTAALCGPTAPDHQQQVIDSLGHNSITCRRNSSVNERRAARCEVRTTVCGAGSPSWRLLLPGTRTTLHARPQLIIQP